MRVNENARDMKPPRVAQLSGITAFEMFSAGAAHVSTLAIHLVTVRCVPSRPADFAFRVLSALQLILPYAGRCKNATVAMPAAWKDVGALLRLVGFSLLTRSRIE